MRFLLVAVNAKYIHSNPAVYSLRRYAGQEWEDSIEIAEYTINNRMEDILAGIYGHKPDVVAFSCYIWNWELIQDILEELPKLLPGVPIWLGGPEVSFDAQELLTRYPMLTGIMVGEGEQTFRELLFHYAEAGTEEYTELEDIAGLVLPGGRTKERELTCLSDIPFLYEDLGAMENKILYYESSRGCPYRCSYCLSSIDKKVRIRDICVVKRELQTFLDKRVPQVKFVDRTFNCNPVHAMEIWQYLIEHDNGVTNFHFEVSGDILTEEELTLLERMRPGLAQLEIGVQSANSRTLREIDRSMDLERLERNVTRIRESGNIHLHLDLIAGLPYEDYGSFGRSFDRVYAMRPEQLQLGFLKVLKGSRMHEKAADYGLRYMSKPPYEVLYTDWLPYEAVLKLKRIEEMVELYYNSNQFTHTLPVLERRFPSPFSMYEAMADFYEKKGYFTASPARAYRYQVLLDFATAQDPEGEALYRELLTYDIYLRENSKSRPDFAGELSVYKEAIRGFYEEEETKRAFLKSYADYDARQLSRMTHMEHFTHAVWEKDGREPVCCGAYVLFDYSGRNPLTGEARTIVLRETGKGIMYDEQLCMCGFGDDGTESEDR